jgi:hypothetical protein
MMFSRTAAFHAEQLVRHLYEARTSGDACRTAVSEPFVSIFDFSPRVQQINWLRQRVVLRLCEEKYEVIPNDVR